VVRLTGHHPRRAGREMPQAQQDRIHYQMQELFEQLSDDTLLGIQSYLRSTTLQQIADIAALLLDADVRPSCLTRDSHMHGREWMEHVYSSLCRSERSRECVWTGGWREECGRRGAVIPGRNVQEVGGCARCQTVLHIGGE
jgi:hypothetical protein